MRLFSTEQVTKYHPDKLCDQISDAVLDACIAEDPESHVACEAMAKGDTIILAGEITTLARVDYAAVARRVCEKLGYKAGNVILCLDSQSPEIAAGVGSGAEQGAGDQGMMYGYAVSDTKSMLPYGFDLANRITKRLEREAQKENAVLKGDAKTQVTVDIDAVPNIASVKKVLVSACHVEGVEFEIIKSYLEAVVLDVLEEAAEGRAGCKWIKNNIDIVVNPAGAWTIGGPAADCGLTGRKIVCDQYGGYCAVGGGAFSGKDPSKVDRSGAYMARKIACDLVQELGIESCAVQLAYAIGQAEPMSVMACTDTYGKLGKINNFSGIVKNRYDLTPTGIIKELDLKKPIYEKLAEGCHYYKEG